MSNREEFYFVTGYMMPNTWFCFRHVDGNSFQEISIRIVDGVPLGVKALSYRESAYFFEYIFRDVKTPKYL